MNNHNQIIGKQGETDATAFMLDNGFCIIDQNYRFKRYGEIDIIASKDNLLVFVEVKSRKTDRFGGPLYAITAKKKHILRRMAELFLVSHPEFNNKHTICRFDLLAIDNDSIEWVQDIIR